MYQVVLASSRGGAAGDANVLSYTNAMEKMKDLYKTWKKSAVSGMEWCLRVS
jgi:energy-converting hydrogenase Eha subunit G